MKNIRLPIALMLTFTACAGCSAGATVEPGARPAHTRGAGKPGAAIDLSSSVPAKTTAGLPIAVEIHVVAGTDADAVRLDWSPGPGLRLLAPADPLNLTAVSRSTTYRHTLSVSAANDGVYHLGVLATLTKHGVAQTRAFSIRVVVGSAVEESKPALNRDSNQQMIESMPARESTPR